jgi:hypothetical protein
MSIEQTNPWALCRSPVDVDVRIAWIWRGDCVKARYRGSVRSDD